MSMKSEQNVLSPDAFGWTNDDNTCKPLWTTIPKAANAADSSSSVAVRLNHYAQGDAHAVVQAWNVQHSVNAGEVAAAEYGI